MIAERTETGFVRSYFRYFVHPVSTLHTLTEGSVRVSFAALAVLVPAVGYTIMYFCGWIAGGAPSSFKPWLALPMDQYYKFDTFICLPSLYLCWIAVTGFIQLMARAAGGRGSFEQTAIATGFAIGIGMWPALAHDLTDGVLAAIGVIDMRVYEVALNSPTFWRGLLWTLYSLYAIWLAVLFSVGVRGTHRLSRPKSTVLGIVSLVLFQGVYLVFNR